MLIGLRLTALNCAGWFEADIDALIYIYIKDYASKMPCENN